MKLSFRKSGGFAPIFQGCEFDTANAADVDAAAVEALARSSNIINEASARVPQARDVFYYTFDVELDGKTNKVTFDQLSVPEKVKPLLDFLMARSKNMLPD